MANLTFNGQRIFFPGGGILNFIVPPVDPNKLIDWTNSPIVPFDTFISSDREITHAIVAPGTFARCYSNEQEIIAYGSNPGQWGLSQLAFDITWNSGTGDIQLHALKNGASQGWSTYTYVAGTVSKSKGELLFETDNYSWEFRSPNTGIDFTIENAVWTIVDGTP